MKHWYSTLTAICDPFFGRGEAKGDVPAVMTTVSVENTETWEQQKKFTVSCYLFSKYKWKTWKGNQYF